MLPFVSRGPRRADFARFECPCTTTKFLGLKQGLPWQNAIPLHLVPPALPQHSRHIWYSSFNQNQWKHLKKLFAQSLGSGRKSRYSMHSLLHLTRNKCLRDIFTAARNGRQKPFVTAARETPIFWPDSFKSTKWSDFNYFPLSTSQFWNNVKLIHDYKSKNSLFSKLINEERSLKPKNHPTDKNILHHTRIIFQNLV